MISSFITNTSGQKKSKRKKANGTEKVTIYSIEGSRIAFKTLLIYNLTFI